MEKNLKFKNQKELKDIATYMVQAVKRMWDLKDLIWYFEQDNNFDYKVRVKIWEKMNAFEMPKTYDNILTLLKAIAKANKNVSKAKQATITQYNRGGFTALEYHREPTPAEIKFGHGATHYRDFPLMECVKDNGDVKKRLKSEDGLIYTRH